MPEDVMEGEMLPAKATRSTAVAAWEGAASRGLKAKQERDAIIGQLLQEGIDKDYGIIPGTKKPTLLKPGAEKINDALNLYPAYEPITSVEDFETPLFFYRYRCILKQRGTDIIVATGVGSCNSREDRFAFRKAARLCPDCGEEAIIKGKEVFGGGWLCYKAKGGCGSKWRDTDATAKQFEGERVGKDRRDVEDIFTDINSIDKMAQKRSLIAATLNLGFSEQFTQDMEDRDHEEKPAPKAKAAQVRVEYRPPPAQVVSGTVDPEPEIPAHVQPTLTAPVAQQGTAKEKFVTGIVSAVSEKKGGEDTGKPWTRYGIKIGDAWYNTFSDTFGATAKRAKENKFQVELYYEATDYRGKPQFNIMDIIPVGVTEDADDIPF